MVEIPIYERSRKYGYLYWRKTEDELVRKVLGGQKTVEVVFNGYLLGEKRIDWKHRRLSLGYAKTRRLPKSVSAFRLTRKKNGQLTVSCQ